MCMSPLTAIFIRDILKKREMGCNSMNQNIFCQRKKLMQLGKGLRKHVDVLPIPTNPKSPMPHLTNVMIPIQQQVQTRPKWGIYSMIRGWVPWFATMTSHYSSLTLTLWVSNRNMWSLIKSPLLAVTSQCISSHSL